MKLLGTLDWPLIIIADTAITLHNHSFRGGMDLGPWPTATNVGLHGPLGCRLGSADGRLPCSAADHGLAHWAKEIELQQNALPGLLHCSKLLHKCHTLIRRPLISCLMSVQMLPPCLPGQRSEAKEDRNTSLLTVSTFLTASSNA
ncbi:hypothetical protein AOLI_G00120990 [Acnodon oligacanthus]